MFVDCHVHLLPPRRLAGLLKWMHDFYPAHPIPVKVTPAWRIVERHDNIWLEMTNAFTTRIPKNPRSTTPR
jgi:hypothetical protein